MQHVVMLSLVFQHTSASGSLILGDGFMTTLAVRLPSGRGTRRGTLFSTIVAAIDEGLYKAERYQTLARMTDAELASLGLRREDLPRAVMFGKV